MARGLDESLARQVAEQLTQHDALAAHARDELGISETMSARPVQAAFASAGTFAVGAALPMLAAFLTPVSMIEIVVSVLSLVFLALLGGVSAYVGGAPVAKAVARVTFWAHWRWRQLPGSVNYSVSRCDINSTNATYIGIGARLPGTPPTPPSMRVRTRRFASPQ